MRNYLLVYSGFMCSGTLPGVAWNKWAADRDDRGGLRSPLLCSAIILSVIIITITMLFEVMFHFRKKNNMLSWCYLASNSYKLQATWRSHPVGRGVRRLLAHFPRLLAILGWLLKRFVVLLESLTMYISVCDGREEGSRAGREGGNARQGVMQSTAVYCLPYRP